VITFDKNLGPQVFDMPSDDGEIPFLLDYIPGEEVTGVSSYLTTKPSSEIVGILGPHFQDFGIDVSGEDGQAALQVLLEDLRAISSSLVMQLNSSKNKAFEVIGSAFAKRVLEKKGLLENAFLIPIDLHQNLFDNLDSNSKSRADNLFISIDKETSTINVSVLEIKCRKSLGISEREDLKMKMIDQIDNTIFALKQHYDPNNFTSEDRLDREIKNKELKSLLAFYIDRAFRYKYISENAYNTYWSFIQNLDKGFKFKFNRVGFIFDFSFHQKHLKETLDDDTVLFTFGEKLIAEILDPYSDLNTRRLEDEEFRLEFENAFDTKNKLDPFIQQFKSKLKTPEDSTVIKVAQENESFGDTAEINEPEPEKELMTEDFSDEIPNSNAKEQPEESAEVLEEKEVEIKDVDFDILVGKANASSQYGILGKTIQNKTIAMDLSDTNTISLFGVQGGGKSYTIGTVSEMVLKQFGNINKLPSPLAGVIFHYSESMDYEPEFTSMIYPNDNTSEVEKLKTVYGAEPDSLDKVVILTPLDKVEERKEEFPSIEIRPLMFSSQELNVQDWLFLLGAIGNDSSYIKQLKYIMKEHRRNITMSAIRESVENSDLLSNTQKQLAKQKLNFAQEYIDDEVSLSSVLEPGKLVIVDLRDEFIVKDEALGLFVIMLNIFSGVREFKGKHFNKFIVFDEAHKYMDNKDLTGSIVTAIREMRHKGVSIMIASQDPPSLPNEIIELSSMVLLHKFNSPQWLKHIQKSVIQLNGLTPADMSILKPGEAFLWATKANDHSLTLKPVKISTRPRVTKHGGATKQATGN
ncbi:MAG: ATP-binding protein, partial [Chryseobacterium gambrini]|nr:ATP-binding protein [Chryseobacterium gambrini]